MSSDLPSVPLVLPFGGSMLTPSSDGPPSLTSVNQQSALWSEALCNGTINEPELTLVGGVQSNLILTSKDGDTWTDVATSGRGLRSYLRDGDTVYLCGEYGTLYRGPRDLSRLELLPLLKIAGCMFSLAKSDGMIYVGGDSGFLARSPDGTTYAALDALPGTVHKLLDTPRGLLVPTAKGLFVIRGASAVPERLGVDASVNMVCVTRSGTIVGVGANNTIVRSTDGGATFKPARVPAFVAAKVKKPVERPAWLGNSSDLNVIAELGDGRLVCAGDKGVVLYSSDDGESFDRLPQDQLGGSFWAIAALHGKVYIAGESRTVLRVG